MMCMDLLIFFFKQKTAYEMRISDWSSDVCSSDLREVHGTGAGMDVAAAQFLLGHVDAGARHHRRTGDEHLRDALDHHREMAAEIGSASCRERVCQYV